MASEYACHLAQEGWSYKGTYQPQDGTWIAEVKELDGCFCEGDDPVEALNLLVNEILPEWLDAALEDGTDFQVPD